jgi:hypothetical protein
MKVLLFLALPFYWTVRSKNYASRHSQEVKCLGAGDLFNHVGHAWDTQPLKGGFPNVILTEREINETN